MTTAETIDKFRERVTLFLVGSFVGALALMVFWGMPITSKDIVTYMVGQLSGMTTMALGLYFTRGAGQDAADAAKSENTGKAFEAIKAVTTPPSATSAANAVADAAVHKADEIDGEPR